MKFIADCMLGKLARWLRILGYDTLYYRDIRDADLLQKALETGRILLTRDTRLFAKIPLNAGLFVQSDHLTEQLQQVVFALHLDVSHAILTRCITCNTELTQVEKSAVEPDVPDFIYHTHNDFSRCPQCGKIYWKGSHQAHIWERVQQLKTAPVAANQTIALIHQC